MKLNHGQLGHLAPLLEDVAHEPVELVKVAEARLDDAEELVAIRRAHFSTHARILLAASVVHAHRVSNGASAGAATLCGGQPDAATAERPASIARLRDCWWRRD